MNVLWITNRPLPAYSKLTGSPPVHTVSWLVHSSELIAQRCSLGIAFPDAQSRAIERLSDPESGIGYIALPDCGARIDRYVEHFRQLRDRQPFDAVNVWGTESYLAHAALKVFDPDRLVLSLQGFLSQIARHYADGIPVGVRTAAAYTDPARKRTLESVRERIAKRGRLELQTLKACRRLSGRTTWDRALARQINPAARYDHNNRILRKTFYGKRWDIERCRRHTVFMTQAALPYKGLHHMLEALSIVKDRFPDAELHVAGEKLRYKAHGLRGRLSRGPYLKYIERLIRDGGLEDRVRFLGPLDEEAVCEQFLHSHVAALPSSIENSPNALGEAMILGVPCVAACVGGVPDMLRDREEGFLYPHDEPHMLAHFLCEIFDDDDLALKFSANARNHALETHDREKNVKQLLRIYESLRP